MVLCKKGKNRIRTLIVNDLSSGEHGTDGTAPTISDTDLGTAVSATNASLRATELERAFSVEHVMLSTIGNGTTFKEYVVYLNSDSVMLDRVVYPDFDKTNNLQLTTITYYAIE